MKKLPEENDPGTKEPKAPVIKVIKNVAFFGDAEVPKDSDIYQDAFEIAKSLATEGFTIVNGGGPGIMDASTQGAVAGEGETISVTFYPKDSTTFEGRYLENVTDREVVTTNYIDRMFKLLEHAHMFIVFKGGTGTISEFGTAWVLAKLYHGHHKPFILYGDFWIEIIDVLKRNMNISALEMSVFEIVTKKEDILPTIRKFETKAEGSDHSHCRVCAEKAFMQ